MGLVTSSLPRPGGLINAAGDRNADATLKQCDAMFVGEAGGQTEHRTGRPFSGKTGSVLDAYIAAANLSRSELVITNVYPFWTGPGNPDPSDVQIKLEEWRLVRDLAEVRPKFIGAVGRIAAQWFLGDVDMETVHGVPHFSDKAPGAIVVPIYHPAAGFYDPDLAAYSQNDVMLFSYYLHNPTPERTPPEIEVVYVEEAPEWIEDAAVDTEGLEDRPWGMSWSQDGKTTYVWTCGPGKRPPKLRGRITFHNAPHDLKILRAMNIDTRGLDYDDTMVKLFNVQLEPQGLKPTSYRHLGLKMQDFNDVVRPHFNRLALSYFKRALAWEYPKPAAMPVKDLKKRKHRIYRPQGVGQRIWNILRAFRKAPEKTRLEKRWRLIGETDYDDKTDQFHGQVESKMGRFPEFSIFCVPDKEARDYSGIDAAATRLIEAPTTAMLKARNLERVYEMDRRALPFVDRMQEVGMRVDLEKLREFEAELEVLREARLKRVQSIVSDRYFNPGSSDQVANWLYHVKGLPVLTFTDTGRGSTSDGALQMLRGYHAKDPDVAEFLVSIQDYREADKYLGTYVGPLFKYVRQNALGEWRVHPNFRVTRVVSGRLSSHEPNILAIPTRTKLGKKLRYCFIARDGWLLIDCDLSQIELRTMADHCRDVRMREAFENNEDLHALTASIIFKIALSLIEKDGPQRYVAKTINFAVMYGISAVALLEQLYKANIFDYTREDCEVFIREWFRIYGSVRVYLERIWKQAAKDGFVRDMWGRICYVPNLRVLEREMLEAAQRLCGNFPIQGGASGTVKRAETRLFDTINEIGAYDEILPILQMHDELLIETPAKRAEEVKELVVRCMTADQGKFSVPIKADGGIGPNWGEAKH